MKRKTLLWILLGLIIVFGAIQLVPVARSTEAVNPKMEFAKVEQPPAELATLIKNACYDCHSYETKYPWYANVAPVSWWIQDHVEHGREHLNFSTWGSYPMDKKLHKMEEVAEEVEEGKMPMKNYVVLHSEAKMTDEQKEMLENWFMGKAKAPAKSMNIPKEKDNEDSVLEKVEEITE